MPDTFTLTVIFIVLSTLIAALIRRTSRDKCLKDFQNDFVTLEETSDRITKGKLALENTGFELILEASATYSSRNYFKRTKGVKVEFR